MASFYVAGDFVPREPLQGILRQPNDKPNIRNDIIKKGTFLFLMESGKKMGPIYFGGLGKPFRFWPFVNQSF